MHEMKYDTREIIMKIEMKRIKLLSNSNNIIEKHTIATILTPNPSQF
jgi:hypothetical protein